MTENLNIQGHLSTFRSANTRKNWPVKSKNNDETVPKQRQNNFENVKKTLYCPQKWPKWPHETLKVGKFLIEYMTCGYIYQPLELKIKAKVGLLNNIPKQFANKSKTTLRKSRKRFFLLSKIVKNEPLKRSNFDENFKFQEQQSKSSKSYCKLAL